MIVFHYVSWKNFLSTGNSPIVIDLQKNTKTLVVGNNGSGKSTLLDALNYALFNKPFRNINKPNLINTINGKELLVEVSFSIGCDEFLIRRGMKPSVFEIIKNGKTLDQENITDQQDYLEKSILKFRYKAFNQIVVLGSARHTPFMQLETWKRREIIEDLLDISIFSKMNTLLKGRVSINDKRLTSLDKEISIIMEKAKATITYIDKQKNINDDKIDGLKKKVDEYLTKLKEVQNNLVVKKEELLAAQEKVKIQKEIQKEIERLQQGVQIIERDRDRLQKEYDFFDGNLHCPKCKQDIDHAFKHSSKESLQKQIDDMNGDVAAIKDLILHQINKTLNSVELYQNEAALQDEVTTLNKDVFLLEDRIKNTKDEIKKSVIVDLTSERQKIKDYKAIHNRLSEEETIVKQNQKDYEIALGLLKDDGIKAAIIKQYIPVINKLINKYLASMDFFVNFELDETFEETIKSRYRDIFSYENFSEGEKQKIDLALVFTWRDIAKMNNSMATNLLIMDEIFDSSLDTTGCEELMNILLNLNKDVNLFVISHKTDIMTDKFSHVIRAEKIKNFTVYN